MMGQDQAWALGRGLDNAVRPHREFTRRFAKGIGKLTGNMPGDHQKKTKRLAIRMLEVAELAGKKDLNITNLQSYTMVSNDALDVKLEAFEACMEDKYFRFHKTPEVSIVDITILHLEGNTIQWYEWFEHTHGICTWRCKVKARQPYTIMATISFTRIEEEKLNLDAQRTKIMDKPATIKPSTSPAAN
ncbi:hypothetical protein B296_00014683 [Ensete ventricosum]|uniref:Uncharacterized protein n=1 Tax=Ensete ventricosum TaxID=4639 RepID=A0A426YQ89_ENSVE|nr:hypothetical protein B296_00014683 [Ensete ventricosum]